MQNNLVRWAWRAALVLLLGVAGGPARAASAPVKVVLSTDVGNEIDDQWAIVYMLTNPHFDVLGIMSAHGPTLRPPAGHTSYLILQDVVEKRLRMAQHPPLLEGASLPLASATQARPSAAATFLIETSKKFTSDARLTVLAIGAVTDIATAILTDPGIVDRIRIVDMGFKQWPDGGEEYNVANDVAAMQVVLASNVPLVVGSGVVCRADLSLSLQQAGELTAQVGPIGAWLWDEFQDWYYRFVKPLRKEDYSRPWVIWDIIVMAHLLDMTHATVYPRPVLRDDMTFEHPETKQTITWITDTDSKQLWADFVKRLNAYQRAHMARR